MFRISHRSVFCGKGDFYRIGGAIWSELGGIEFAGGAAAA
jgi:hypothetical protein